MSKTSISEVFHIYVSYFSFNWYSLTYDILFLIEKVLIEKSVSKSNGIYSHSGETEQLHKLL